MLYVIAGNAKQYDDFCRKNNLNPRKDARYVSNHTILMGARDIETVWTGTCYDRSWQEMSDIYDWLKIVGHTDVSEKCSHSR